MTRWSGASSAPIGRGYLVGIVVFGLFGFLVARTQAPDWGTGAAIGAALFVAVFVGILGGVVLIGLWAMKNEELIRGNETGHAHDGEVAHDASPAEPSAEPDGDAPDAPTTAEDTAGGRRRGGCDRDPRGAGNRLTPLTPDCGRPPSPLPPRTAGAGTATVRIHAFPPELQRATGAASRAGPARAPGHEPALVLGRAHP